MFKTLALTAAAVISAAITVYAFFSAMMYSDGAIIRHAWIYLIASVVWFISALLMFRDNKDGILDHRNVPTYCMLIVLNIPSFFLAGMVGVMSALIIISNMFG